jgi:predicted tellurium resistance membrane protein TerC
VLLLLSLTWIMGLTKPLFTLPILKQGISGRDLVLLIGGLFLIWKSVREVHEKLEEDDGHATSGKPKASFTGVIVQILLLDIVFSLDSVITAVGMANTADRRGPRFPHSERLHLLLHGLRVRRRDAEPEAPLEAGEEAGRAAPAVSMMEGSAPSLPRSL